LYEVLAKEIPNKGLAMQVHLERKLYSAGEMIKARSLVIERFSGEPQTKDLLLSELQALEALHAATSEKNFALNKLKEVAFGSGTESKPTLFASDDLAEIHGHIDDDIDNEEPSGAQPRKRRKKNQLNIIAPVRTEKVCLHTHEAGETCPNCSTGRLYNDKPRTRKMVVSTSFVEIVIAELETLRCRSCEHSEQAIEPKLFQQGHAGLHASIIALLANLRYCQGMTSWRIQDFTQNMGLRIDDSRQFQAFYWAAQNIKPVFESLELAAANSKLVCRDDSPMKIILLRRMLKLKKLSKNTSPPGGRMGINTTAMRCVTPENHQLVLYKTTNKHCGENFGELLLFRETEDPLISMSDALASNDSYKTNHTVKTAYCLVHARRNFYDLRDYYPADTEFVLSRIAEIYKVDEESKSCTPDERLRAHQEVSKPLFEELLNHASKMIESLEPNSYRFKAWNYLLKHQDELTLFYKIAGVPLDNNTTERALKKAIRHRKNSLFFQTQNGAQVGDILMSMMETAQLNSLSPVRYLQTLLENWDVLHTEPESWLPWNQRFQN